MQPPEFRSPELRPAVTESPVQLGQVPNLWFICGSSAQWLDRNRIMVFKEFYNVTWTFSSISILPTPQSDPKWVSFWQFPKKWLFLLLNAEKNKVRGMRTSSRPICECFFCGALSSSIQTTLSELLCYRSLINKQPQNYRTYYGNWVKKTVSSPYLFYCHC